MSTDNSSILEKFISSLYDSNITATLLSEVEKHFNSLNNVIVIILQHRHEEELH